MRLRGNSRLHAVLLSRVSVVGQEDSMSSPLQTFFSISDTGKKGAAENHKIPLDTFASRLCGVIRKVGSYRARSDPALKAMKRDSSLA